MRINSNILCSPFSKAQMTEAWKCLRQAERLDDLALCIWRSCILQQQQPAVARHWKIYGGFFLVASFPRSSVPLWRLRFRPIIVTRVLTVKLYNNKASIQRIYNAKSTTNANRQLVLWDERGTQLLSITKYTNLYIIIFFCI